MNPKLRCPRCGGLFYWDWMTLKHKCPTVSYIALPSPEATPPAEEVKPPVRTSFIDTVIYDNDPLIMYKYFYDACIEHAKTCLLCKSLAEIGMCCPELTWLRVLRAKWCIIKCTQEATRP